ncbi:membrane protein [Clostridiales bacterium PH28_bin88]|nr:membrane protein [Clostridiales bacterium PH28_bin88]
MAFRLFWLVIGSAIVATGLEIFLVPNSIIDGGVVGISIIISHLTKLPLGLFLVALNVPFLFLGYKYIGKTFVISTFTGVTTLALFVTLLHPVPRLTGDLLLAAIFGGVLVGTGVGMIIKNGGSLDGTEILAILAHRTKGFSIGEVVMFFNVFILGSAGLVFGWDRAMYSLIAYFIAFRTIDVVIDGLDESKSVTIISNKPNEISEAILARLGRGLTHVYGKGGYSKEDKEILYCIVTRLELAKLKSIIQEIDDSAFVAIEDVHEVLGGGFRKKAIH